jgi:sterol desaturase/sphingolipid hydroxylase (fatty acid hydroxylase superfamily)
MNYQMGGYRILVLLVFFILITLEVVISRVQQRSNYNVKETGTNFMILSGLIISKYLLAGYQLTMMQFFSSLAFFQPEKTALLWLACFIITDLLIYFYHFFSHKSKILWAFHVVHHSSPWMNFTTAYRLNWLGGLLIPFVFFPVLLLGFPPEMVALCVATRLPAIAYIMLLIKSITIKTLVEY